MARFKAGDVVRSTTGMFRGTRTVKYEVADSDGDITLIAQNGRDWFYANELSLEKAENKAEVNNPPAEVQPQEENNALPPDYKAKLGDTMSNNRRTVSIQLIDPDAGLDVADALVKDFGVQVVEGDEHSFIQQLIVDNDVAAAIEAHNKKRAGIVNLDIKRRTGQEVKLDPVKLRDLKFIVK